MDAFYNLRQKLGELFENKYAHAFIAGLIIISTLSIGYEVSLKEANAAVAMFNNLVVIFCAIEFSLVIITLG